MSLPIVILIGAVLGALGGAGIFFEPREPYKWQILCTATLKGVLIALLTGVFDNCNYAMVARDCNRRSLRIGAWARDLSRQGRSQIGRRPLRGFPAGLSQAD